jgi:hypothetical protein
LIAIAYDRKRATTEASGAFVEWRRRAAVRRETRTMPKPLEITISHDLGKEGARRRVDESIAKIRGQIAGIVSSVEQEWDGDRLRFRLGALGQAIAGEIEVLDDTLHIVVGLPGILGLLGGKIAEQVKRQGTLLLAKS